MNQVFAVAVNTNDGIQIYRVSAYNAESAKSTIVHDKNISESDVTEVYRWFGNMDQVKKLRGLELWFSKDAMRFFGTRVSDVMYAGRYFVTSEKNPSGERRYSVRMVIDNGDGTFSIDTVGDFHSYASRNGAHASALRAAFTC